jgi:cytoskeletal protein CcmA (bactofilin family)
MFKKETKSYTDLLGKTNRIVEGTKIKGDINSLADFRFDGELIGNFHSNGKLVLGPSGFIKGEIICKNADIEGKVERNLQPAQILRLTSKAIIRGEVICGKLAVEPGAEFSATCVMKPNVKLLQPHNEPGAEEKTA